LTIDRNIQKEVSKMVKDALIEFRANQATVLIMDPKTGAIITSVSYPDFDPNEFASVYEIEKVSYSKYPNPLNDLRGIPLFVEDEENGASHQILGRTIKIREANEEEVGRVAIQKYKYKNNLGPGAYQNAAISSLYEPGSVFKAVTTAIGIDTGDIRPGDTYFDKGYAEIDTFKIKNVSSQCLGRNSYTHALDFSCNV
jgi:cell division protein FtsI/penicillin-binding protein 2